MKDEGALYDSWPHRHPYAKLQCITNPSLPAGAIIYWMENGGRKNQAFSLYSYVTLLIPEAEWGREYHKILLLPRVFFFDNYMVVIHHDRNNYLHFLQMHRRFTFTPGPLLPGPASEVRDIGEQEWVISSIGPPPAGCSEAATQGQAGWAQQLSRLFPEMRSLYLHDEGATAERLDAVERYCHRLEGQPEELHALGFRDLLTAHDVVRYIKHAQAAVDEKTLNGEDIDGDSLESARGDSLMRKRPLPSPMLLEREMSYSP